MRVREEDLQGACWYGRRTPNIPANLGIHTIEDGRLLFCAHPMWFPVVGYQFDVRNCLACEYFKPARVGVVTVENGRRT